MPKIYLTKRDELEAQGIAGDAIIPAFIYSHKSIHNITNADIAKQLGVHANTMTKMLKHPEDITQRQLRLLAEYLHFNDMEKQAILNTRF